MTNNPSERILKLLHLLYPPEDVLSVHASILDMLKTISISSPESNPYLSERNVTLISYGDSLQNPGEMPLRTLQNFLHERLKGLIATVHILPFYPYSSDDGFSVMDYTAVNPHLGNWDTIQEMSKDTRMMFDGVINHMSAESAWFKAFLADDPAFKRLFISEDPRADLQRVTRPRITPLLTPFEKADGTTVYVWTTFSADQVDFDYHDPDTLLRILRVLLFYVERGAEVIRLDAIAYLWKEIGTSCIHLPQAHAVIQLIRAALDIAAPHVVLITETNVPHAENISYFGSEDRPEAQLVYNFTLPPLLFYTLHSGDAHILADWVNMLDTPRKEAAFLNFTASHDGIGVRPLEGILKPEQINELIQRVEANGGKVSYKTNSDGSRSPYELNITYIDAVTDKRETLEMQARCFLVSQAIMLALAGVPAIYIHSLLGSRNDVEGVARAGHPRAINREKLDVKQVIEDLNTPQSFRAQVFHGYAHLIRTRMQSPAFHPSAQQRASVLNQGRVFALERTSLDGTERLLCLFNITSENQTINADISRSRDLLTKEICDNNVSLRPYQVRWLQHS